MLYLNAYKIKESVLNLHTVTFSGASNETSIDEMCNLYNSHPYIEWGIQTPHYGGGLFPDPGWVKECRPSLADSLFRQTAAGRERAQSPRLRR